MWNLPFSLLPYTELTFSLSYILHPHNLSPLYFSKFSPHQNILKAENSFLLISLEIHFLKSPFTQSM